MDSGWIKLHRSFAQWEWYNDSHMVHLFLHLILNANHRETSWKGIIIQKGQLIVGRRQLSAETGISENTVRTCIKRLKSTHELTSKSTNQFTILTICKYDFYQSVFDEAHQLINQQTHQQTTSNPPTTHQQLTTNKNNKNSKNIRSSSTTPHDFDFLKFFEFFHSACPNLPRVMVQSDARKKLLAARLSEFGEEKLRLVFTLAGESDFLNGKNDKNWSADFDWILKPANFIKILENKYRNKPSHETFKPADPRASAQRGWDIPL